MFQKILSDSSWNLYILTSTQEDFEGNSYLFLYNKSQELHSGRIPDYETGIIEIITEPSHEIFKSLHEIFLPDSYSWVYNLHWIIEGSW